MEVIGKIRVVDETKTVGAGGFRKRELVVTTDEQYPQHIMIEFVQDKCDLLNSFNVGEEVKVSINLRGREWVNPQGETKYFNAIQGWRVEKVGGAAQPAGKTPMPTPEHFESISNVNDDAHYDLPF